MMMMFKILEMGDIQKRLVGTVIFDVMNIYKILDHYPNLE